MSIALAQQLAEKLNGREYGSEITKDEEDAAKALQLVVVFGYSDDNMELRGAINDEFGCYEGAEFFFHRGGVLADPSQGDCEHCGERVEKLSKKCLKLEAVWGHSGYSWKYETDIPHATFDIMEGDEKYCRGIVFQLSDLPTIDA